MIRRAHLREQDCLLSSAGYITPGAYRGGSQVQGETRCTGTGTRRRPPNPSILSCRIVNSAQVGGPGAAYAGENTT